MLLLRKMTGLALMILSLCSGWQGQAEEALVECLQSACRVTHEGQSATAFFVRRGKEVFLVTAAHLFEKSTKPECQMILRGRDSSGVVGRREIVVAVRKDGQPLWKKHANEDVAALRVKIPSEIEMNPVRFDRIMKASSSGDSEVKLGQTVWLPGYPAQLEANAAGWPVLRQGMIASYPLSPVATIRTMLVDIRSFGGDSGAPIFTLIKGTPHLAGMIVGMHRQTDHTTSAFEDRTVHTPLGLAIALQGNVVAQTIALFQH